MAGPCLVGGSNFHSCRCGGPRRRTMALGGSHSPSWSTSVTFAASHSLSHFQLAIFFFLLFLGICHWLLPLVILAGHFLRHFRHVDFTASLSTASLSTSM